MSSQKFVDKWRPVTQTERATAQAHFLVLPGKTRPQDMGVGAINAD
ncbi:hypothetical protein BH11ARM2_BH11ARM2_01860 [soil metagenome]